MGYYYHLTSVNGSPGKSLFNTQMSWRMKKLKKGSGRSGAVAKTSQMSHQSFDSILGSEKATIIIIYECHRIKV
jgi:hypothetical protein